MSDEETPEAIRAEIKAARAAREAIERPDNDAALRAELAAEKQALRDAQAVAEATAAHGAVGKKIALVHTPDGVIILKKAGTPEFKRFQELEKFSLLEVERLVFPCRVYPDAPTFDRLLDEYPAKLTECAAEIGYLAGVARKEQQAKS